MTLDEYTLALTDLSPEKREAMLGRISEGGGLPVPFRFSAEDVRKVGLVEQLKPIEIPMNGPVRF